MSEWTKLDCDNCHIHVPLWECDACTTIVCPNCECICGERVSRSKSDAEEK